MRFKYLAASVMYSDFSETALSFIYRICKYTVLQNLQTFYILEIQFVKAFSKSIAGRSTFFGQFF